MSSGRLSRLCCCCGNLLRKRVSACYFFAAVCNTGCYSQSADQNEFTVFLRSGLIQQTTTDHLLNDYNYSGNAAPLNLEGFYFSKQHLFTLNLLYQSAKLYPDNIKGTLYEFNDVRHKEAEFKLEYFHKIIKGNTHITVFAGISNSSYVVTQQEHYKSLLALNAEGYRESYAMSALSLSPALLMNARFKRNSLMLKVTYSILNYTARPDDNFVKQLGLPTTNHWNWYAPANYTSTFLSCMYQYEISRRTGITAEYNVLYRKYTSADDYRYLRHSFLLGLYKTF